jgi:transposase
VPVAEVPVAEVPVAEVPVAEVPVALASEPPPARSRGGPAAASRRARRQERYEIVVRRRQQGWTLQAIAEAVGLDVRTIRRWLSTSGFPERPKRSRAPSTLDPYRAYLDGRIREGCTNAAQLWRELKERGFGGGRSIVSTCVRELRGGAPTGTARAQRRPSLRRTAWLLTRADGELSLEEHQYVTTLVVQVPELAEVQAHAVEFGRLLREHDVGAFDVWLGSAARGPLAAFVASLRTDERAVRAAVAEAWSNGPVEGQVNRLKLVKRQMYGRAGFELLRARVLHAA